MNGGVCPKLAALSLLVLTSSTALGQLLVYQNTSGTDFYANVGGGSPPSAAGDLVTLLGGANTVTSLTAGFRGENNLAGTTADLSLSFYNPGPLNNLGLPTVGTQLGSTVTMQGASIPAGAAVNFDVTFLGLNIAVPNNVIWAITISNLTGTGTLGWTSSGSTATVGSSDVTFAYQGIPLSAGLQPLLDANLTSPTSNLTAEIMAVPEPGAYLVVFGTLCLGFVWQRRHALRA